MVSRCWKARHRAVAAGGVDEIPGPDDLVVLTWNAHMFEGDLGALIADLRDGH